MRDLRTVGWCGAFMEFSNEEATESGFTGKCAQCGEDNILIVPKKEVKEQFRQQLIEALPRVPNLSPSLKHFWFFARCNKCHQEIVAMRS